MQLPDLLAPEVWQQPALSYTLEHFGVSIGAITGVLAARGKQVDLFGVIVLALVTAFGGGTIRDVALGDLPVFWATDSLFFLNAAVTAFVLFSPCDSTSRR